LRANPQAYAGLPVELVRNAGRGVHGAVMTGFATSTAPFILMFPPTTTATRLWWTAWSSWREAAATSSVQPLHAGRRDDRLPLAQGGAGAQRQFTLRHVARLPTTDASNGFRLFSRRAIERIAIESTEGFCYSIELLVKAHRLNWKIAEVPVTWIERQDGRTRFQVLRWLPAYLRWYFYAFATTSCGARRARWR